MAFKESDFQSRFNKWAKHNWKKSSVFELKIVKSGALPFNGVLQHQKDALEAVKHRSIAYKLPDDSRGYKPFDSFILSGLPAYVVIMFYKPRKSEFIMVGIDAFLNEEKASERKSLTESRAKEIGEVFDFR